MKLPITGCLHPPVTVPLFYSETNPTLHGATNTALCVSLTGIHHVKLLLDCYCSEKQGRPETCGRSGQVNNLAPLKTVILSA